MITQLNFIKKLSIILPLLVSGNIFANELTVTLNNNTQIKDLSVMQKPLSGVTFLKFYPQIYEGIDKIKIKVNVNNKLVESISNYDSQNCEIEINYGKDLKPLVFNNLTDDLIFAVIHEIGHCRLGSSMLTEPLKWIPTLNMQESEMTSINQKIIEMNKEAFNNLKERDCSKDKKCIPSDVFKKYPPMLAYHEIFADLWAITKFKEISCEKSKQVFKRIEEYRYKDYEKNPKTLHQSFLSTYYLQDAFSCENKFDLNALTFYTQKGFIDYINSQ